MNPRRLAVVLPAYNEEGAIAATVGDALAKLPELESDFVIIPVDDGSSDATGAIIDRLAREHPGLVVALHNGVNRGYGGSLRSGFDRALEVGATHVFFMDADGQFDIADLARLLPLLAEHDAALGFRLQRSDPPLRKLNALAWQTLVRLLYGVRVRDLACAFKILPATFLERNRLFSTGAVVSTEILVRMHREGVTYAEAGVRHLPRRSGVATGARPAVILKAFAELFRLGTRLRREAPPVRSEQAAVDVNDGTVHVRGGVRSEEADDGRDLLRSSGAPGRD